MDRRDRPKGGVYLVEYMMKEILIYTRQMQIYINESVYIIGADSGFGDVVMDTVDKVLDTSRTLQEMFENEVK